MDFFLGTSRTLTVWADGFVKPAPHNCLTDFACVRPSDNHFSARRSPNAGRPRVRAVALSFSQRWGAVAGTARTMESGKVGCTGAGGRTGCHAATTACTHGRRSSGKGCCGATGCDLLAFTYLDDRRDPMEKGSVGPGGMGEGHFPLTTTLGAHRNATGAVWAAATAFSSGWPLCRTQTLSK